jgi:hypothetical protein
MITLYIHLIVGLYYTYVVQAHSAFYMAWARSAKFGLYAGKNKFNEQAED